MTKNKKIIIGILIVVIGWICFRTAIVSYSFYQDGWRLGNISWEDINELGKTIIKTVIIPSEVYITSENPCVVCVNGCDTCPEGCDECLIGIEKKLKDPNMKWYYDPDVPSWKSYKDEKLGYEIKYPPTWSIAEERKDFGIELFRIVFQSKDYKLEESEEYKEVVARGEETGLLPEMVLTEGVELSLVITEIPSAFKWQDWAERATDYPYGKIVSEKFFALQGKEIYERRVESGEITSIVISFPDSGETKLFELMLHTLKKDEDKNSEILKQIVSDFNFLK
ncbi:MAG: hypothetical protein V1756_00200 [Patescibacteria group bacterium]